MDALEQARAEIDTVDAQLAALFERRMAAVLQVAEYKRAHGLPIYDAAREAAVLEKAAARIQQLALRPYYKDHVQHMMDIAKQYEAAVLGRNRAAYQGVEGAFAHIALKALFPHAEAVSYSTWDEVFDSGLGGLTGVRELRKRLPHEDIIYFGDTGRVPYGSRSPETILQYARQDVAFLLSKNVKCIMAACGTVSSTYPAAEAAQLPVPYLGVVDAAAREAAFVTRNRRIGVIGTAATIRSRSYEKLLRQLVPGVEITARACPLFVPLVEAGYVDHSEAGKQQITKLVIAQYLTEVREAGVDTLILGCTHYPLLKSMIGEFMGPGVTLVDPAMTAAHHLERMLAERGLRASHESGQAHFYVSDVPDSFVQTADLFLGEYKGGPVEQIAIDKY